MAGDTRRGSCLRNINLGLQLKGKPLGPAGSSLKLDHHLESMDSMDTKGAVSDHNSATTSIGIHFLLDFHPHPSTQKFCLMFFCLHFIFTYCKYHVNHVIVWKCYPAFTCPIEGYKRPVRPRVGPSGRSNLATRETSIPRSGPPKMMYFPTWGANLEPFGIPKNRRIHSCIQQSSIQLRRWMPPLRKTRRRPSKLVIRCRERFPLLTYKRSTGAWGTWGDTVKIPCDFMSLWGCSIARSHQQDI